MERREVESSSSEAYLRFTALRSSFDTSESASFIETVLFWGEIGPDSCVRCESAYFVQPLC